MGCKDDKLITELVTATGFNRNIMGCKGMLNELSSATHPRFNRNIMGCKANHCVSG